MWNNYLSNHKWKSIKMIELDEDILINLSCKYEIPLEDLESFTSQQISDLIETWDPEYSKMIKMKISKELGLLFDKKYNLL